MANKVKLGAKPKTFKPVTILGEMPDGTEGAIEVTYKYFTKTESGALFDEMRAAALAKMKAEVSEKANKKEPETGLEQEPEQEPEFSLEKTMAKTRDQNAAFMLRVIDSWDLDAKLSLESLQQLDDELPAFAVQIMDRFRHATQLGRLGN